MLWCSSGRTVGSSCTPRVREEWQSRAAAAIVDLGGGYGCCTASVFGHARPTIAQKKVLSGVIEDIVGEFRSRGRGPCLVGGDINVEPSELAVCEVLARAGWAD